jgi:hypothetical protein
VNFLWWTGYAMFTIALVVGTRSNHPHTRPIVRALLLFGVFCWLAVIATRVGRA